MVLTAHSLASIGAFGALLAVLGSLYWAYEILGGQNGPMNFVTRTVSYSLLFGVGYGLALGAWFGTVSGLGFGILLSLEQQRVARHQRRFGSSPLNQLPIFGVARGGIFMLAAWLPYGWKFAVLFGSICGVGLYFLYHFGYAPSYDYRSHARPVISRRRLVASLWRGLVIGGSGVLAGVALMNQYTSLVFGLEVGVTAALVSTLVSIFSPMIEYWADHLPDRRLAAMGVMIMLIGMLLQSLQYVVVLLAIPVH